MWYGDEQSRGGEKEGRDWYFKQGGQGKLLWKITSVSEERLLQVGKQQMHRPQARTWVEGLRNGYGQCGWVGLSQDGSNQGLGNRGAEAGS